ncbi:T9SS type A sorting domain-containing protein [bacterium SCSIO 12741]|nr:T9SS type A sorting domain-containing protein [bacterium SCSIO 12741]
MKTSTSLISLAFLLFSTYNQAQELTPIYQGQIFEQGYSRSLSDVVDEESALDVVVTPNGLAFCGWIGNESIGKNMAVWNVDDIGDPVLFGDYGTSSSDEIATAMALSSYGEMVLVGRETNPGYTDDDHDLIKDDDRILIKVISAMGQEIWTRSLDSLPDTAQVAVDVINDGSDNFIVLANRMYDQGASQDIRLFKLSNSGQIVWNETITLSNQMIFAQKIIPMTGNNHYLILANDVTDPNNSFPMVIEVDGDGVYETREEYALPLHTKGYGIAARGHEYVVAGLQHNGGNEDGIVMSLDGDLLQTNMNIIVNDEAGNEGFRDVVSFGTGLLATGYCDNRGEGLSDVWVCHLDTLLDTTYVETLGGVDTDYGRSAVYLPGVNSAFVVGYNNSYTIEESGNAYLGGIKVGTDFPAASSASCQVPRSLFVDRFTWHDGNGGIDLSNNILGNATAEANLINYAKKHNITYLILYGLNFVYDPNYQSHPTTQTAKNNLNSFIAQCARSTPRIHVGLISTTKEAVYLNAIDYNDDVVNNSTKYNYNNTGKISYFVLEHEFWNPQTINASTGPTAPPTYDNEDGNTSNDVPNNQMNVHFDQVYDDHKDILDKLDKNKKFDANVLGMHDYIGYFFNRWSATTSNTSPRSNLTKRSTKAAYIESHCDGIFLVYYQRYSSQDNGKDFLTTQATSGVRLANVDTWKERIGFLGQQSNKETNIMPLFSAEMDHQGQSCGDGNQFLGRYLEDPPGNGAGSFFSVETSYQSQHNTVYNNTTSYPDIQNVKVIANSWFTYSCVDQKDFGASNGLPDCNVFNSVLSNADMDLESDNWVLYPNPNNGEFFLNLGRTEDLKSIEIFDLKGKLIHSDDFNHGRSDDGQIQVKLHSADPGMYLVKLNYLNESPQVKKCIVK